MRVIGVLVWADEDPLWLSAAVTSLSPLLDHLVALDGKYVLYPGAMTNGASDVRQSMAVLEAASACHLGVTLHRPTQAYTGNEVEKRQLSVDLAKHFAESEDDWVLVFDADMIARKFSPGFVRNDLEQSDHLVAEYARYEDPADDGFTTIRGLYRLVPSLKYGPAHYTISVEASDGERLWLWGQPAHHTPYMDALDLTGSLGFDHRNTQRDRKRKERVGRYYDKRDALGVEKLGDMFVQNLEGEWVKVSAN